MHYHLKCAACGAAFESSYPKQVCGKCGSILEVVHEGRAKIPGSARFWDYERLFPDGDYRHYRLGGTKLTRSREHGNLFFKMETYNPTRSFKDRGSVIEVAKAREYGYKEIALASTGNMAYSVAHFSKLAGMRARVFISRGANPDKLDDIRKTHDAAIVKVDGDFTKAQRLAELYCKRHGSFLGGDYCYRKEGQGTVAYEIMAQLPGATHIIVPVGNATLMSGLFKALTRLRAARRIRRLPRLIAVQAERCDPLVRAFRNVAKVRYERPRTAADAIAVGLPTFGDQALAALN